MVVIVVVGCGELPVLGFHLLLLEDDLSGTGGRSGDEVDI